jgi:hypothetical protein
MFGGGGGVFSVHVRNILRSHFPICAVVTWRCDRVRIE